MENNITTQKKNGEDNEEHVVHVVLNSQNSPAIRELMDKLSDKIFEKNRNLYERLAKK